MTKGERKKLIEIHNALDESMVDSDPIDDLTMDEIREDDPVLWAAIKLSELIGNDPW